MRKRDREREKAYETTVEIQQPDLSIDDPESHKKTKKTPFAVVEAYKKIRTNILFQLSQCDGKVIAISSADVSEGKSTTSLNLAVTFSQTGGHTLLVDADLRRASLHKKMKIENKDGFSNVLAGFSDVETAVHHLSDSMDILTAGPIPPNPSELLGSKKFVDFIAKARETYDYIIIDTPPIDIVSDALVIAPHTDGMILVIRSDYTAHYMLQRALDSANFAKINILGVILNGVEMKAVRRYNKSRYARYKKGYGYGYGNNGYGYGNNGYGYGNNGYGYGGNGYGYGYGYGNNGYGYGGYGYGYGATPNGSSYGNPEPAPTTTFQGQNAAEQKSEDSETK